MEEIVTYIIPPLGFGVAAIGAKKTVLEGWRSLAMAELILGILIMGASFLISYYNSKASEKVKSDLEKIIESQRVDSISNEKFKKYVRDTFGIEKKGDTAKIINNITYNSRVVNIHYPNQSDNKKSQIDSYFADLDNSDYYKREIALDKIVGDFPDTLSNYQVEQIKKYFSVSNIPEKLCVLIADQPYLKYLESFCKYEISKKSPTQQYLWKYLYTKTNVELTFVEYAIKLMQPNYSDGFQKIFSLALIAKNFKKAKEILNSHSLVNLFVETEREVQKSDNYQIIKRIIEDNQGQEKWFDTYFFDVVKY